jgi:hypothetical protein
MDISDLNFKPCICGYQVDQLIHIIYRALAYLLHRFVASAGITSKRILTNVALPVGEFTPMMLLSSNPSLPKSEFPRILRVHILLNV